jgi:tRNA(Ile)-lysidine synthase
LEPLYDRSNLDPGFFRNRVRHELLPEMARYWPGLQRRLWQTADILREDQRSLAWFLDEVWNDFLLEAGENYLVFRREAFLEYPVGVQRRLVRRVFARLRPDYREVSFQTVERARECIQEPPPSKEEDLAGELRIRAVGAYVYVCPRGASPPLRYWPQMLDETPRALTRSGTMEFSGPWAIKARVVEDFQGPYRKARRDQDVHQAWFDLKEVDFPLLVRPRKPGERFAPLGMDGHTMKISDFMVNEKVPNHVRDQWPLVLSGGNVLWIPGLRQSHQARIREQTRAALQLVLTGGSIDLA